jgi:hypothetical protein
VITASAARRALARKARRAEFRRQVRAAIAAVLREERSAAELGEPGELVEVRYLPRSLSRTLPQPDTVQRRICRLAADRVCPCERCEDGRQFWAEHPGEDVPPGRPSPWPELHEAETARELALWHALVWGPEAAGEAAQCRPDDRPDGSAWAQLRAVLEAAGVLLAPRDHGPPGSGGVVVLCHPRTGPPVAWSAPEAPLACP